MTWNRHALATCAAPAVLVIVLVGAFALLPPGSGPVTVFGAAATACAVMWALSRVRALYGVAVCLAGAEGVVATLKDRGVVVSRYKALEISAGLMEAQRVARERKTGA